jgi:alpha-ketoglutaric semialdehyde dehydrogenase
MVKPDVDCGNLIPNLIPNWINGQESLSGRDDYFNKLSPHDGELISKVIDSGKVIVNQAVKAARAAQNSWAATPAVKRGYLLHTAANLLEAKREKMAAIVALETGKSHKEALGETDGAVALGRFYAGEGQRLYGRTTTSGTPFKHAMTVRQPCGVAALITAANTPIANVAWKTFPALVCGNSVILKPSEDSPITAWFFAKIFHEAGVPPGVLNVIQGSGQKTGAPLVLHPEVDVISFTGSSLTGIWVGEQAAKQMKKVSLELGGKNPFVVCDDADLDDAVKWAVLSAFSNAGQRCAAASRIIVFDQVYEKYKAMLLSKTAVLKIGPGDGDDLGPVINEKQLKNMVSAIDKAIGEGAKVLAGGNRITDKLHVKGYYLAPTLLENVQTDSEISTKELFGPIACLFKADNFEHALELANNSPYGLTAAIHTKSLDRAWHFVHQTKVGVAVVNAGTYGSEPHMPFGGLKLSGNGSREPGTEALDVYSELKDIFFTTGPLKT